MRKPYLSKLISVGEFEVFIVDGSYVRKNLNEEFTNFGQHFRFKFIPKKEFWLDKEFSPGEFTFYINHLITEYFLMSRGMNYKKAIIKADSSEQKERMKSSYFLKYKKNYRKNLLKGIHKKLLKKYSSDNLKVWVVNGELVRDFYFIDFTEGGHDKVYNFVPKGEIWLDDDLSKRERKFVLLHEVHERNLMLKGLKYPEAHHSSSIIEHKCRKYPFLLNRYLRKEFKNT